MIEQVLNRQFVLDRLADVRSYLQEAVTKGERRGETTPLSEMSAVERQEALDMVATAQAEETAQSTGQPGYDLPAKRRGGEPKRVDDVSYVSRSPVIGNLQSALEEYFEERRPAGLQTAPAGSRRGGGSEVHPVTNRRLLGRFEPTDVRWVSALVAMGLRGLRGRHAFRAAPATQLPVRIANNARLLLVGDWGSGVPRARRVADQMSAELQRGRAENREQHVIHLGDVYYSGWEREYRRRFLECWPVKPEEANSVGSWNLNGNHDMYSGGHAYYDVALADPRFQRQRGSSFFALENDQWRIFGLDTAYEDFDLADPQAEWVRSNVANAPGRKIMLLSHHQLFSAYESGGPKLEQKLRPVLANGGVTAWFWGHEHRCVLYNASQGVKFGRCIGHGGVPVYMNHAAEAPVPSPGAYEYRDFLAANPLEHWALFGFVVLDFNDGQILVRYINENGQCHKTETIA